MSGIHSWISCALLLPLVYAACDADERAHDAAAAVADGPAPSAAPVLTHEVDKTLPAPRDLGQLDRALAGPALGIGVALGAPSRLQLEAAAGEYIFGFGPAVAADDAPRALLSDDPPAPRAEPRRMQVGGGAQLRLGVASSRVRITAPDSPASVRLAPVAGPDGFATWGPGVASGDAVVYASPDGQAAVVQSASAKGLKEDIVLTRSLGATLRFTWDLELDEGLEARLGDDGSIGIYGAAGVLAGTIEIGDDKSRALLDNARRHAGKTELRFLIPAPVVRVASGETVAGVAHFELGPARGRKATLQLIASGLDALAYPLSLDPSVVVTSATDFGLGGNLEGGADLDVSGGRVKRGPARGGVGTWTSTTAFSAARQYHTSVAYNGYLYVIGGINESGALSDVQVAPINADGTLGPFAATTSLPTARYGHASVAYNGYLYVIGGSSGGVVSSVVVAPINADGTLSAFAATTSFTTARFFQASVVYNGYLYIMGGAGSGYMSDVQVAPINADGTLGAFVATTSFTTGRTAPTGVAYNGYIYVMGGSTGAASLSDVQVAPINANGTLGAFAATTSMPIARYGHTSVAYHGYLYVSGGYNAAGGVDLSDVQMARFNANGTLGAFAATTSFPTARRHHTSVAYNGYLYVIGGDGSGFSSDVQVAPIGSLGGFSATTSIPSARWWHASVAYDGYLYVIGGLDTNDYLSDVQVAPINANGTLGAFAATTSFSTGRYGHTSVAYEGYLYVVGGRDYWGNALSDVQVARINADGTLDGFAPTTYLPYGRGGHTSVVINGYLYVVGGDDGYSYLNDVQVAPITADGTLGVFAAPTYLPTARSYHTSVAFNGFLYVVGGYDGSTLLSDVQVAYIFADGTLGEFAATTSIPTARQNHASVALDGFLYVIGGVGNDESLSDVQVAPINENGTLGAFATATSIPTARYNHESVAYNGYLYVIGGFGGGGYLSDVQVAPIAQVAPITANGNLGAFAATTSFATERYFHTSVAYNAYLYVIGGANSSGDLSDVEVAHINANGTVGAFSATTSLPTARFGHTSVAHNGYLYVIGGNRGGFRLGDVQLAAINADGTLGAFAATTSFTTARENHTSVAYNGYLYVIGGSGGNDYLSDVQVAPINTDGTLGAFAATTSLPTARIGHTSVAYNGYLYVIGGNSGSGALSDVQVTPIEADGTLGVFAATTSMPTVRRYHTSVAYNGYLYVIGGSDSDGIVRDVRVAPINANGTLGAFAATTSFNSVRLGHTSVAYNGLLYVIGGSNYISYRSDVQVAPLLAPLARGRYSKVLDFGGPSAPVSITVNGSPTKGEVRLDYRTAPASGVFGATTTRGVIPLGTAVPLSGADIRYMWVSFTLDDTSAVVLDGGNERDITDFSVVSVTPLIVSPATVSIAPKGTQTFVCSGGSGSGYVFAVSPNNSGASIDPSTGAYVAGVTGSVSDTVTCTDSLATTATAVVTVTAGISISPASPTLAPGASQTFTATGGSETGFVWAFVTNDSQGTLSGAGAYQAGSTGGVTDTIQVTDSLGNTKTAVITVKVAQGSACVVNTDCGTNFCVDGVCCNGACGDGVTSDCQACSVAGGAAVDGTCGVVSAGNACGDDSVTACSGADTCNAGGTCLTNDLADGAEGTCPTCQDCDGSGVCVDVTTGETDAGCTTGATGCSDADTCSAGTCLANDLLAGSEGDCGTCQDCNGSGACADVTTGETDAGCAAGATGCSDADTCSAGTCLANDLLAGSEGDCGTCQDCNGSGACADVTTGQTDAGCATGATGCSAADTCSAGTCLANDLIAGSEGDCGTCQDCNGSGACADVTTGQTDAGCTTGTTGCSAADTCSAGTCLANDLTAGSEGDCGTCQDCNGSGACADVTTGETDAGCTTGATGCSDADTCSAGTCLANDLIAGSEGDCGTCQDCNGSGACADVTTGETDAGCTTGATGCSDADTCSAGTCLANDLIAGSEGDCGTCQDCNGSGACADVTTGETDAGCAAGATGCSAADSCSAGTCLANDLIAGSEGDCATCQDCNGSGACAPVAIDLADAGCDATATDCSAADTCDGAGTCLANHLADGAEGECATCQDCDGSGACVDVSDGQTDAGCSATATGCSGADTCSAGSCAANDLAAGSEGDCGTCQDCDGAGSCGNVTAGVTDAGCAAPSGCAGTTATCTCAEGHFGDECDPCPGITGCSGDVTCTTANNSVCDDCADGRYGPGCAVCAPVAGCIGAVTCTSANDSACAQCADGTFGPQCTACSAIPGCIGAVTCTSATDSTCGQCADGTFGPQCTTCAALPGCTGDVTCTSAANSVCSRCEAGTFGPRCTACSDIAGCAGEVTCTSAANSACDA